MFSAYPARKLADDEAYVELAIGVLEDFDDEIGKTAIKHLIREKTFLPSIAEIVSACREVSAEVIASDPMAQLRRKAWHVARGVQTTSLTITDRDYVDMIDAGLVTLDQAQAFGYSLRRAKVLPKGVERPTGTIVRLEARRMS